MRSSKSDSAGALPEKRHIPKLVNACLEWVREQQATVILGQSPINLPRGVTSVSHRGKLLTESSSSGSSLSFQTWPDAKVSSLRYPVIVVVMEGEADFRLGVTRNMKRANPKLANNCQIQVLQLPQRSLLLVPPGVPLSDGDPHWERSDIKNADLCLLWFSFVNHGVLSYYCTTRSGQHTIANSSFMHDPSLLPLVELIIENMKRHEGRLEQIEHLLLVALLLLIEQDCGSLNDKLSTWPGAGNEFTRQERSMRPNDQTIERARTYIETHMKESIDVAEIAAHSFVSAAQLNYLFRAGLGISVMGYVVRQRISLAKMLLHETDLPILEISRLAGYSRPNYFARAFRKVTHQLPREYRQSRRPQDD